MQKLINGIAILSGVVSLTVVGSGVFIYLQKDAIIDKVKDSIKAVSYTHLTLPTMDSV